MNLETAIALTSLDAYTPEQPRDSHGRWSSGNEDVQVPSHKDQLEYMADLKRQLEMESSIVPNQMTAAKYVLEHGKPYFIDKDSFKGKRSPAKQCYQNSAHATLANSKLTYVEGYVNIGPLSLHHAWNVDEHGNVRDSTLKLSPGTISPRAYFGVPFTEKQVYSTMLKTKVYGIISYTNPDLFKK